jgi:hypothetical protein
MTTDRMPVKYPVWATLGRIGVSNEPGSEDVAWTRMTGTGKGSALSSWSQEQAIFFVNKPGVTRLGFPGHT